MTNDSLEVPVLMSVDDKTRHWLYFRATPRTQQERQSSIHQEDISGATVSVQTKIHNGRLNHDLKLDNASFELVSCPTKLSTGDFYRMQTGTDEDAGDLTNQYYQEVETFIKKKLRCDKVVCFHSQVRNADKAGQDGGVQGYANGGPHTDSSAVSADELALQTLASQSEGDEGETYERYLYLNLWRNISDHPIEDNHLAMLDERTTVKPDDYIPKDLFGDGYNVVQYGLNARHATNHQWYYFPQMTKNEAILFKQMDSDWTKSGRVCFHMSVSDENKATAQPPPPPRESIELRMMCFWKKADSGVNSMPTKENMHKEVVRGDPLDVAKDMEATYAHSFVNAASVYQLILALLRKIPLVGLLLGNYTTPVSTTGIKYSGKPHDYLDQFVKTVDSFPSWPKFAVTWVSGQMKRAANAEMGISNITRELVNDAMGYQKTKAFKTEEKQEITDFLLANERYMQVSRKHWEKFAV